ncbi:MipA/OmpV family protein [Mesoterricola silvestris]|uniref:MipA/OmpV family protein n=1 Tax=Mesoterricola silvestris TaxID=2927979 RepID=A0AA48H5G7_9BACT|nr:MipA/OmpV family protein [Mesoterricola silvestris]BDU72213.1 hypothetical protein METEAL_13870 [Mesoterricola silvestris]
MSLSPLVLLACLPLAAQDLAGGGAPSDHWTGTVGAMVLTYPSAPGSATNRTLLLPTLGAQYGRFYLGSSRVALGFGGGVQVWRTPAWTWEVGVGAGDGRPENRAPELAGMGDRSRSVWAGTGLLWRGGGWNAKATVAHGLRDSAGNRGTLSVGRILRLAPQWTLSAALHADWADADNMAYDFGITPEQALRRAALVAAGDTRLKPGDTGPFAPGAGLRDVGGMASLIFHPGPRFSYHLSLFGGAFQGGARTSPLVRRETYLNAGAGFGYRFG